ncbi:MAG: metallophosphoesterase, partial [Bacteroidales bacterium]|nr:metallophosphoesterase [Bacteroidales bacterium]
FKPSVMYTIIKYINWGILPIVICALIIVQVILPFETGNRSIFVVFIFTGILVSVYGSKLVFILFHFVEDLISSFWWIYDKIHSYHTNKNDISNYYRITAITKAGIFFFIIFLFLFIKGMVFDRFRYKINHIEIVSDKIPVTFNNYKIVHISDIHIPTFYNNEKQLQRALQIINNLKPDLILFTGDLVLNTAKEINGFTEILQGLNAKQGIYSILGNHDYGDYYNWKTEEDKIKNMQQLIAYQKDIGFQLLLNENRIISRNGDSIAIIGVENWGKPPFPQYGDLNMAMQGVDGIPFKILLSHDPSHWEHEVLNDTDIDLTLSGHTHGMQFGIYTKMIKWSPIQLKYKKWGGLYSENGQQLYVNVGLGSIAYPGRVGVRPEITLFHLTSK